MALISDTIPNLINGVSQQPSPTRIRTACEDAVNAYMSVVSGLQKRQNSEYICNMPKPLNGSAATHMFKGTDGTKYMCVASSRGLEMFNASSGDRIQFVTAAGYDTTQVRARDPYGNDIVDKDGNVGFTTGAVQAVDANDAPLTGITLHAAFENDTDDPTQVQATDLDGVSMVDIEGNPVYETGTIQARGGDGAPLFYERSFNVYKARIVNDSGEHDHDLNEYITGATSPQKDIKFLTIADKTYILNTSKKVAKSAVDESNRTALNPSENWVSVFIRRAVANTQYAIYVDNKICFTTKTSTNTDADNVIEGTATIATKLKNSTTSFKDGLVENAEVYGSVLVFQKKDADHKIKVLDQFGGAAVRVIEHEVQEFSDLPPMDKPGRLIKVVGDAEAEGDDYWVKFNGTVWVETFAYGEGRTLDPTTMPHTVHIEGGKAHLMQVTWADSLVGDAETNSDPTFVNNKINSMFVYKGRMGFLTDENLVMSEVSDFTNFYRTTVTQLLDTERIDIASTTNDVNILRHAVAFGNSLVLFSDKQQFKVTQGDVLSPVTIGLQPTTAYDGSKHIPPVNSGPNVFFAVDGPLFSIVREMYIDENNGEQFDAAEITIQVPKYIPTGVSSMAVSTYEDALVLLSEKSPNTIFVYKWFLEGKKKVQSSWSKWEFDPAIKIMDLRFLDQDLYMVYERGDKIMVDRVRLEEAVALADDVTLLLDHQVSEDGLEVTYDASSKQTTFTIPFDHTDDMEFWTKESPYGEQIPVTRTGQSNSYTAPGNWETLTYTDEDGNDATKDWPIAAGRPINFSFTFSDQYVRSADSDVAIQDGRLQLRYMSVVYQNSSYFKAEVTPKNRQKRQYTFTARTLADSTNVLDTVPIETGEFRFPIAAQNTKVEIKLTSDKPFPCAFGLAEWDAQYHPRTQRI